MIEPHSDVDADADSLLGALPGLVYRCAAETPRRLSYASRNPAALVDPQETAAAAALDTLVHPDDIASVRDAIDAAIASRTTYSLSYRLVGKIEEQVAWVADSGRPGFDTEGRATHLDGMLQPAPSLHGELEAHRSNAFRLRQLLDLVPAPIFYKDGAGRFAGCNPAFAEFLGMPASAIIGRTVFDIALPDLARRCDEADRRLFVTGSPQSYQGQVNCADGSLRDVMFYKAAIGKPDGSTEGLVGILIDITSRLHADQGVRDALARFEAVIEGTPMVAIQGLSRDGRVLHWNRASAQLFGVEREAAMGRHFSELMDCGEAVEQISAEIEQVWDSGISLGPDEWQVRRLSDGRRFWLVSTLFPLFDDGRVSEVFCMDVDITERKAAEARMLELNDQLEERVRLRTAELQSANEELESFSYSVSHDLRAPLRGIDGFAQVLAEDYGDRLDQTGHQHLARIRGAIQRMASLIDDLLMLAQISRSELRCETVDLTKIGERWLMHLAALEPTRTVEWTVRPDLYGQGDPALLELVLQNLLDNAWKFTGKREKGYIEFASRIVDGTTIFSVADNGDGFDPAYAERLFEPFQRLHHVSEFPGTGIGLATVRRIVGRHGGKVWAEAAPGEGATFCFTLA